MPRHEFPAIGTTFAIDTEVALTAADRAAVRERTEEFDRAYSRFRPDSLVAELREPGTRTFPADAAPMLALYRRLYEVTGGAVSPLVGTALAELGYDADYALRPRSHRSAVPAWDDALRVEGTTVTTLRPVTLDFGAAGKGHLVDLLTALLVERGHPQVTVDGSGDLRHRGSERLAVGLENPFDPGQVIGVARLSHGALCGSASNRRRWGPDLHHILDGRTGRPVHEVVATWVTAESALLADGLATALFVTAPDVLAQAFDFQCLLVLADGSARFSPDFPAQLFGPGGVAGAAHRAEAS